MKRKCTLLNSIVFVFAGCLSVFLVWKSKKKMSERTVEYFLGLGLIKRQDAADITWSHAVNSRSKLTEALNGSTLMLEADIIMRGHDPKEPIMAHPPETDSDITLEEWLQGVKSHCKGIKLDFKSLNAVAPSMLLLKEVLGEHHRPVWMNADILPGPGGLTTPLEPRGFLSAVGALPVDTVLSLGWTTGWAAGAENPGYSWDMVREMEQICRSLENPITFPVRAALMAQSVSQLTWLLQQSDRYSLTVWTGLSDQFKMEDLMHYRKLLNPKTVYYDLPDAQRTQLAEMAPESSTEPVRS